MDAWRVYVLLAESSLANASPLGGLDICCQLPVKYARLIASMAPECSVLATASGDGYTSSTAREQCVLISVRELTTMKETRRH